MLSVAKSGIAVYNVVMPVGTGIAAGTPAVVPSVAVAVTVPARAGHRNVMRVRRAYAGGIAVDVTVTCSAIGAGAVSVCMIVGVVLVLGVPV